MRKLKLLVMTVAIFMLAAVGFVACGEGEGEKVDLSKYAGTYKLVQIKWDMGAMIRTYNLGDEIDGVVLTEDYLVFEFKEDGTVTVTSSIPESQEAFTGTKTGTWTVELDLIQTDIMKDNLASTILGSGLRNKDDGSLEFYYTTSRSQTYTYYLAKK